MGTKRMGKQNKLVESDFRQPCTEKFLQKNLNAPVNVVSTPTNLKYAASIIVDLQIQTRISNIGTHLQSPAG